MDHTELEVIVVEVEIGDDPREGPHFVVELWDRIASFEGEPESVQVFLGMFQHLEGHDRF